MKLYSTTTSLSSESLKNIIAYFFNICHKVNIYFPNDCEGELTHFKEAFLAAAHIEESEDGSSPLDPKEGFTMLIAELSPKICGLLLEIKPIYHLSFGLIQADNVVLYIGDEGEILIEDDTCSLQDNPIFKDFKVI